MLLAFLFLLAYLLLFFKKKTNKTVLWDRNIDLARRFIVTKKTFFIGTLLVVLSLCATQAQSFRFNPWQSKAKVLTPANGILEIPLAGINIENCITVTITHGSHYINWVVAVVGITITPYVVITNTFTARIIVFRFDNPGNIKRCHADKVGGPDTNGYISTRRQLAV